jgi:hypothetical protein
MTFARCYGPLDNLLYGVPPKLQRPLRRARQEPSLPTERQEPVHAIVDVRKGLRQCVFCEMWVPRTNFRLDPSGLGLALMCAPCEDALSERSLQEFLQRHAEA